MSFPHRIISLLGVMVLTVSACGKDSDSSNAGGDNAAAQTNARNDASRRAAEDIMGAALIELNMGNTFLARANYERARDAYRGIGDTLGEGHVALGLAQLEHFTGQSDNARGYYAEALKRYRETDSTGWQAKTLAAWGDLEKDTFNWEPAIDLYRRARVLWELGPNLYDSDHVILRLSIVTELPSKEAQEVLKQADLIYTNLGDIVGRADVKMLFGKIALSNGNLSAAQGHYNNARWIYQDHGLMLRQAEAGRIVAEIDLARGYNVRAAFGLELTKQVLSEAGGEAELARLGLLHGDLERVQGRLELARRHYAEAAVALATLADPAEATALWRQGEVNAALGNSAAAQVAFAHAAEVYTRSGDTVGEAAALYSAGRLFATTRDSMAAESALTRSVQLYHSLGDDLGSGRAHIELAHLAAMTNRSAISASHTKQAAAAFARAGSAVGSVFVHLMRGDLARAADNLGEAATAYRAAGNVFASIPSPLTSINILLGQPPVGNLIALSGTVQANFYDDIAGDAGYRTPADEAAIAANLAEFPDNLIEGRRALADLEAALATAAAFAAGQN